MVREQGKVQTPKLRKEASKHSVAKAEPSHAPVPVIRVISTLTRPQESRTIVDNTNKAELHEDGADGAARFVSLWSVG